MPNHKQRKKKDGLNKTKKLQAMRAKEARAKPQVGENQCPLPMCQILGHIM